MKDDKLKLNIYSKREEKIILLNLVHVSIMIFSHDKARLCAREIAKHSCSFSSRSKRIFRILKERINKRVDNRGKKCNTLLRIEIHFLRARSTSLRCSIESYNVKSFAVWISSRAKRFHSFVSLSRILYQTRESWRSNVINGLNLIVSGNVSYCPL